MRPFWALLLIVGLANAPLTGAAEQTLRALLERTIQYQQDNPTDKHPTVIEASPLQWAVFDEAENSRLETKGFLLETSPLRQATLLQPTPYLRPRSVVTPPANATTSSEQDFASRLFASPLVDRSVLRQARLGSRSLSVDVISGREAAPLVSTDLGNLLQKSSSALSVEVQRRTPVVNDARIRGSRIGALAASGSHWVPARADLDTAMSKIDSRQVQDVIVVPGPYSSLYGPGFSFADFHLLSSPRYHSGNETHGSTSAEHKGNGNQWMGQQTLLAGGKDWGVRGSYTLRIGTNYESGDGASVASDYESRALMFSYGRDLADNRSIEFSALRLDQTDIEFPGYVFDIESLETNGYEVTCRDNDSWLGDRSEIELWYNRTDFRGDAKNPEKRRQFPFMTVVDFEGRTDVDSMSTGYRQRVTWGDLKSFQFTVGHDLRFIKQEITERVEGLSLGLPFDVESLGLVPRSFSVNPGLFAEYIEPFLQNYTLKAGARVDYVQTDTVDDTNQLQTTIITNPFTNAQASVLYPESVGTGLTQTDRVLWSLYGTLERQQSRQLTSAISFGYGERPPSLTELYAADTFLLTVQNGLNGVTGDPRLKSEKMLQADVSVDYDGDEIRFGARGFHGWGFDYITFENTDVAISGGQPQRVRLRYVNTRLATFVGMESYLELMPKSRLSTIASFRALDGRDRTRNGDFATLDATTAGSSIRLQGLDRGFFTGGGADSESLPGIAPAEARVGWRLKEKVQDASWNVELTARIVDNQDRVATSLLEQTTPGFTTWDIRGIWQPDCARGMTILAGIENFTDKTYREHLDFRSLSGIDVFQPGMTVYVGTDLNY